MTDTDGLCFLMCVRHTLSLGAIKQGLIIRLLYKLRCLSITALRACEHSWAFKRVRITIVRTS